ncbi:MAG: hypothetical protein EAZ26_01905 [Runella slithyformis]|nr:MAG: hypothetical protein EAZ26_01905 [Runella slithyformis]
MPPKLPFSNFIHFLSRLSRNSNVPCNLFGAWRHLVCEIRQHNLNTFTAMKTFIQRLQLVALSIFLTTTLTLAQRDSTSNFYLSGGGNGIMLSLAQLKTVTGNTPNAIPRFTMFFNVGTNANYDINRHFGLFSGLNLTNIGMITEFDNNVKLKQRVYAVGIPVGIKVGDLENFYIYAGGEAAFAINYKEKRFENNEKVGKFNEWFSERSNAFMPSVFAGFQTKNGFGLKLQYYLNNFLNQSFTKDGNKPYANIAESKLFFVSLGYSFKQKTSRTYRSKKRKISITI